MCVDLERQWTEKRKRYLGQQKFSVHRGEIRLDSLGELREKLGTGFGRLKATGDL